MATVATGMPAGICTIECKESTPERARVCTGTPITGRVVSEATIPGRWAAPPAPAITTFKPRPEACWAKSTISKGVRWAESTRTSAATPKRSSICTAGCMVGRSESLPMITATTGAGVPRADADPEAAGMGVSGGDGGENPILSRLAHALADQRSSAPGQKLQPWGPATLAGGPGSLQPN